MPSRRLLIVAGDPSGDRHAASLVKELKTRTDLRVSALGGRALREAADEFLFPLVDIGGFGFWEPLLSLPAFWRAKRLIRNVLKSQRPALVILVDYYGFNIHIAREAADQKIPVIYYISPQVWASRSGRLQKMAGLLRKMLVIFPFEEALYQKAGIPARFVGHPLLHQLPAPMDPPSPPTIGVLPGSRTAVIRRHLPVIQEALMRLYKRFPEAQFVLVRPMGSNPSLYADLEKACPFLKVVTDETYQMRRRFTLAISVSGTTALENMLMGIPMILFYKLSALTYAVAKRLVKIPFVGMPNILAGKRIVPELLQDACTGETLAREAEHLLQDAGARQTQREALLALRQSLDPRGKPTAADEILSELSLIQASA